MNLNEYVFKFIEERKIDYETFGLMHFIPLILFIILIAIFVMMYVWRKIPNKVKSTILPNTGKPRFRKRDKVIFYGRKMFRKVKTSLQATGRTRGRKRQLVVKLAKRLLRLRRDQPLQLQVKEPSEAFLEEDLIKDELDPLLPAEVIYMLKGIRVFGSFDKPLFLELCRSLQTLFIPRSELLFSIGDLDDSIFIIHKGKLQVYVTEPDGTELTLKEVVPGDTVVSLLSVIDVLSGHTTVFKTVSAKAIEDSSVLRLPMNTFKILLEKYPESLVRVVQIIMVRLQRVTFTALHNHLGLSSQLVDTSSLHSQKRSVNERSSTVSSAGTNAGPAIQYSPSKRTQRVSVVYQLQQSHSEQEQNIEQSEVKSFLKNTGDFEQSGDDFSNSGGNNVATTSDAEHLASQLQQQHNNHQVSSSNETTVKIHHHRRRKSTVYLDDPTRLLSEEETKKLAVEGFMKELCIDDEKLISKFVTIRDYGAGTIITHENTIDDAALFYVLSGSLLVTQKHTDKEFESHLFIGYPKELVGALAVITGEVSVFTVRTRHPSRIAVMSTQHVYDILAKYPKSVLYLAKCVVRRLSPFVRQTDFALDWNTYEAGRAIYRQGDKSDSTYIVLSGRLRSVIKRANGKKELVGEYGRGDLVGIVEVLTQTPRSTTVIAVRDTELAKLPSGLLEIIKIKHPSVVTQLIHLLGHRILGNLQKPYDSMSPETYSSRPSGSNFATVAILAVNKDIPISAFSMEINHALTGIGPTLLLTSEIIRKTLGPTALDSSAEYQLCSWLGQQEDHHRIVLYQCDNTLSAWTQRCIRQSDCILIVASADQKPSIGEVEKQLEKLAFRTQKELILLHREGSDKPKDTVKWLNMRSWCSSNHHIRCPKRVFEKYSPSRLKEVYKSVYESPPNIHSDFSRLARFLTGTSIGLVLGGGGARGAAHVGMIKAIQEAGIPIDIVAGVSIGAFIGALYAQELDIDVVREKARNWSFGVTSYWRQAFDLTYPVAAMFTGSAFNKMIYDVFGERQIEDLWLPYFTITTDITFSCPRIHRHGSLWRYVRSSMSLSGYLPPLCDPTDGHLLLDGGYVNNLPADVMHDVMGVETILAVDVGSQDDTDLTNYGDTLSGWWLLWKRWNPFSRPVKVPNLPEIQSRLAFVSCVRQLEQVKRADYCTYIRPPIDSFKNLQFNSFDEIRQIGYTHGKNLFTLMSNQDQRPKSLHLYLQSEKNKVYSRQGIKLNQLASFTDLAEKVCKIQSPQVNYDFSHSDSYDDDEDDMDDNDEIRSLSADDRDNGDEYEEEEMYSSEPDISSNVTNLHLRSRKTSHLY